MMLLAGKSEKPPSAKRKSVLENYLWFSLPLLLLPTSNLETLGTRCTGLPGRVTSCIGSHFFRLPGLSKDLSVARSFAGLGASSQNQNKHILFCKHQNTTTVGTL